MVARRTRSQSGFSLIELVVVAAVGIMITALALPTVVRTMRDIRLRNSATAISTLIAQARAQAIRTNTTMVVRGRLETSPARIRVWVERAGGNGAPDANEPQFLAADFIREATPTTPTNLGYVPQAASTPIRFNSRGLPCVVQTAACVPLSGGTPVGFFVAVQDTRDSTKMAGISVAPSGRVHVWRYSTQQSWKK